MSKDILIDISKIKRIGTIGNYYGGLLVVEHDDKYYWLIENYDTIESNLIEWTEIPKSLYDELIKLELLWTTSK